MFSYQEIHFVQWSFGIRLCSSKWSFSRFLAFFHLTNDVFEHILFFGAVPFLDLGSVPFWKARTDCSSSLCSFWWNRNVLWCFLGTKWSFIAKRGTNCSKLRICSGPNWSLMDDFGTIVPNKGVPFYWSKMIYFRDCDGLDLRRFASILLINRLLLCKYSKAVFSVFVPSFILKMVQNTEKCDSFLMSKLFLVESDLFPRCKTMNNKTKEIGQWTCEGLALRNFASILLINRLLLCKYSKAVFSVFIASFILKIVQNAEKGDSFLMSKLFLVEIKRVITANIFVILVWFLFTCLFL